MSISEMTAASYGTVILGYSVLGILTLISYLKNRSGKALLALCLVSTLWATTIVCDRYYPLPNPVLLLLEWARFQCWILLLCQILSPDQEENPATEDANASRLQRVCLIWAGVSFLALIGPQLAIRIWPSLDLPQLLHYPQGYSKFEFVIFLLSAISVLLLTEQIIRHSNSTQLWALKLLCIAAGAVMCFDFVLFSDGLMFGQMASEFWVARGFINCMVIPLLGVAAARYRNMQLEIHVSRQVIFHSATFLAAGAYLLAMSGAGYYVLYLSGSWGNLLQITFLFAAFLLMAMLLMSHKLRALSRVWLSKHFFSYKYDYREKWQEFTAELAISEGEIPARSCAAMCKLVHASGAIVWVDTGNDHYQMLENWHAPMPLADREIMNKDIGRIADFMTETEWVIDLDEYRSQPEQYANLTLPEWLLDIPKAWLLVPLLYQQAALGVMFLKRSDISSSINWEDRDLLKAGGRQAAIMLAQYQSEQLLSEARQFEAYHRLSTYVMHDLKNILAQLTLVVTNSAKHKHNPEFIDDALYTIQNSVDRMTRLLQQMKSGQREMQHTQVSIRDAILAAVESRQHAAPRPACQQLPPEDTTIETDFNQLVNIFCHLLQNAQEATPSDGTISVASDYTDGSIVITITDTGCGMTEEFIKHRLFKPFDSTKGLTGMGIGVYESRQYVQSLGGHLDVTSSPGQGSCFTISIPAGNKDTAQGQATQSIA